MDDMDKKKLKELNFNKLLILDTNIENYTFKDYAKNGYKHPIKGMCTICEEEGVNECRYNKIYNINYKLKTIGHGTMTDDILAATGQKCPPPPDWKEDGVLFVLENPGPCDLDIYTPFKCKRFTKFPTHQWYFLNPESYPQRCEYPYHFKGQEYGEFFCSVLFTFKLKNMYITDFVKCGMDDVGDDFNGIRNNEYKKEYNKINKYQEKCIKNCFENYFYKEIEFVEPKIIFCLGKDARTQIDSNMSKIEDTLGYKPKVITLPHPNAQDFEKQKLSAIKFREIYYNRIIEGLVESEIINNDEKDAFYKKRIKEIEGEKNIIEKEVQYKLEDIKKFLKKNGVIMNKVGDNFNYSEKINGVHFCITNNESIISFHWENNKLDKDKFEQKKEKISELFPNSLLKKKIKYYKLYIPVLYNQDIDIVNKSILDIINKTKGIMGYL